MYEGVNGDSLGGGHNVPCDDREFLSLLSPGPGLLLARTAARYTFRSKAFIVVALPI